MYCSFFYDIAPSERKTGNIWCVYRGVYKKWEKCFIIIRKRDIKKEKLWNAWENKVPVGSEALNKHERKLRMTYKTLFIFHAWLRTHKKKQKEFSVSLTHKHLQLHTTVGKFPLIYLYCKIEYQSLKFILYAAEEINKKGKSVWLHKTIKKGS